MRAGRIARAALFASASLAGCDQGQVAEKPHAKEPLLAPRVHGTFRDKSGAPIVGASVNLATQNNGAKQTVTDQRGRYAFDGLQPDTYYLVMSYAAPGQYGEKTASYTTNIVLAAGQDQQIDASVDVIDSVPAMPYGAPPARGRRV